MFGAMVPGSDVLVGRSNVTTWRATSGESGSLAVRLVWELRLLSQSRDSPSKFWT